MKVINYGAANGQGGMLQEYAEAIVEAYEGILLYGRALEVMQVYGLVEV